MGIKHAILTGGFTLAVLAALSVYSLAVVWERWNFYKKSLAGLPHFLSRLRHILSAGDLKEAVTLCQRHPGPAAEVVMAALVGPPGKEERRNAAERALERSFSQLQRRLPMLGTVGSVAPFIGLFGTVLGVMRAFKDLASAAGAGPGVVAVGISEALIATAAGLFVAIPAIVAYNYFTTRANAFSDELSWAVEEILDHLTEKVSR